MEKGREGNALGRVGGKEGCVHLLAEQLVEPQEAQGWVGARQDPLEMPAVPKEGWICGESHSCCLALPLLLASHGTSGSSTHRPDSLCLLPRAVC